jgi:hypothetical protein
MPSRTRSRSGIDGPAILPAAASFAVALARLRTFFAAVRFVRRAFRTPRFGAALVRLVVRVLVARDPARGFFVTFFAFATSHPPSTSGDSRCIVQAMCQRVLGWPG